MGRTIEVTICETTLEKRHIKRGEDEVWLKDGEVRGFYVREKPEGARIFVFRWRLDGKNRSVTIGIHGSDCDCETARARAMEMRTAVRQKKDPRTVLEVTKEEVRTVTQAVDDFFEKSATSRKKEESTIREYRRLLEKKVVPVLGDRLVGDIAFKHVQDLHESMKDTPREANNVVTVFKVFLRWCERMGYRPRGLPSVTEGLDFYPENVRERVIAHEELRRLLVALNALYSQGIVSRSFYFLTWLIVLTGARRGQVEGLRWEQVRFSEGTLDFKPKDTRKKRARRAPKKDVRRLAGVLLQVLQCLHQERDVESPWVFPADTKSGHIEDPKRPWNTLLKVAGVSNLRRHDFRHQYATEALEEGIAPKVASDITGHAEELVTQRYYQVTRAAVAQKAQARLERRILRKGGEVPHLPEVGSGQGEASAKSDSGVTPPEDGSSPLGAIAERMPKAPPRLPDKLTLQLLIETLPVMRIAEHFGTSDKRIAKLCAEYGIEKPKRGDWTKRKAELRREEAG